MHSVAFPEVQVKVANCPGKTALGAMESVTDAAGGAGGGPEITSIGAFDPHPARAVTVRTRQKRIKQRGNIFVSKYNLTGEFNLCTTKPPRVFARTSISPESGNNPLQLHLATVKQCELLGTSDLRSHESSCSRNNSCPFPLPDHKPQSTYPSCAAFSGSHRVQRIGGSVASFVRVLSDAQHVQT